MRVHVQVSIAAAPNTSIDSSRGVVTFGNLTLAFHLAPDDVNIGTDISADRSWAPEVLASRGLTPDEAAAEQLLAAASAAAAQLHAPGTIL